MQHGLLLRQRGQWQRQQKGRRAGIRPARLTHVRSVPDKEHDGDAHVNNSKHSSQSRPFSSTYSEETMAEYKDSDPDPDLVAQVALRYNIRKPIAKYKVSHDQTLERLAREFRASVNESAEENRISTEKAVAELRISNDKAVADLKAGTSEAVAKLHVKYQRMVAICGALFVLVALGAGPTSILGEFYSIIMKGINSS